MLFAAALAVAGASNRAMATPLVLSDGNATATVQPDSNVGLNGLTVDGVNQVASQWYYYRLGSAGGETSIDHLTLTNQQTFTPNLGRLDYSGAGFTLSIVYDLAGGGKGSDVSLSETISIHNTSTIPSNPLINGPALGSLDMHFFEYSDFDLNNTANNDALVLSGGNTADQMDAAGTHLNSVSTPIPTHQQAAFFPVILNSLTDGNPTTFNDFDGPINGDATFGNEWDAQIAPGGTYIISKVQTITPPSAVPLPPAAFASLATIGAGAIARGVRRLRRGR
jgi:hypothetical protein